MLELHNYFDNLTKLFSELAKFLNTSVKSLLFSYMYIDYMSKNAIKNCAEENRNLLRLFVALNRSNSRL